MSPRRLGLALLAALASGGCAASSIEGDVARARALARVERLAQVADVDVDPAAAEDARRLLASPLDADAAVRVALLNNRELRATLRELGVPRGALVQAGLLPNPVVEAELLPERNTRFEVRVEYDLTKAVLAPLRARAAGPDLEAARYRAAAAVVDLGYRVRSAFYRLQSAEQRLSTTQQVLDTFAAARDAARALFAAGNVRELDLAATDAAYERARVTAARVELDVATERERVQRLLGAHGAHAAWRVRDPLPAAPARPTVPEDVETQALRASLELAETRHRLEGLARRVGVARAEGWLPDVTLDVHGLQGNPEAPAASEDRSLRLGAGVSVGVPVFDRRQGTVVATRAELDGLLERYFGLAVDVRSAARDARSRVTSAHGRARQYQEVIVPAQARVTAQTLLQYNAMQVGVFQLLQARREELDARLAQIEALREYWSAVAELDALLAGKRVAADARAAGAGRVDSGAAGPEGGH